MFASIALLFFFAFLATPTIVSFVERDHDTSVFFTLNEEEQSPAVARFLAMADDGTTPVFPALRIDTVGSSVIHTELRLRHDNVTPAIFAPPPNYV